MHNMLQQRIQRRLMRFSLTPFELKFHFHEKFWEKNDKFEITYLARIFTPLLFTLIFSSTSQFCFLCV